MSGTEEGLHLYACGTPNGHKPLIALEELGRPYKLHNIDLAAGEQRKNDFLRINPAGRIPVLVDHDAGDVEGLILSESGAILFYLAEKDASHRLLPAEAAGKAEALSWVFYQLAHLAPHTGMVVTGLLFGMQHSKEAMQTAVNNIRTAFKNLDARLAKTGGWLVGGQFTIADIANISAVLLLQAAGHGPAGGVPQPGQLAGPSAGTPGCQEGPQPADPQSTAGWRPAQPGRRQPSGGGGSRPPGQAGPAPGGGWQCLNGTLAADGIA